MEKYNGWANYATWRTNLEIYDGMSAGDFCTNHSDDLPEALKDYATEVVEAEATGVALGYAMAFLSEVDWYEIAKHIYDE